MVLGLRISAGAPGLKSSDVCVQLRGGGPPSSIACIPYQAQAQVGECPLQAQSSPLRASRLQAKSCDVCRDWPARERQADPCGILKAWTHVPPTSRTT